MGAVPLELEFGLLLLAVMLVALEESCKAVEGCGCDVKTGGVFSLAAPMLELITVEPVVFWEPVFEPAFDPPVAVAGVLTAKMLAIALDSAAPLLAAVATGEALAASLAGALEA